MADHIKRRLGAITALVVALLGGSVPVMASEDEGRVFMLADFEASGAAADAVLGDPVLDQARSAADLVPQGDHALRFSSAPWADSRGGSWPSIRFDVGLALREAPWHEYAYLTVDVVNPDRLATPVTVHITDAKNQTYSTVRHVRAFGIAAVDVPLREVADAGIDLRQVTSIKIDPSEYPNPWRAPWAVTIYLDNIRLTEKPPQHAASTDAVTGPLVTIMRLGARAGKELGRLRELSARIPDGDAPADRYLRGRIDALIAEIETLRADANVPRLRLTEAWRISDELDQLDLAIGRIGDRITARAAQPDSDFGLASADSMRLVYPRDLRCECDVAAETRLGLARGEYESVQVVAIPYDRDLRNVTARVTEVEGPEGKPAGDAITTRVDPVGSLMTRYNGLYHTRPGTVRPANYEGWVPDPIMTHLDAVDVARDDVQSFWMEAHAAKSAQPGRYTVTVEVTAAGMRARTMTVLLDVWNFALPERPKLATAMTFNPATAATPYRLTDPEQLKQLWREHGEFLERFKIEPDNLYRREPTPAQEAKELKDTYGLRNFNIMNLDARSFDPNAPETWQDVIDRYLSTIDTAMREYEAAGVAENAYIYGFDESTETYWPAAKALLTQIKQRYPSLRVMTTLRDPTLGERSGLTGLVDIWVPDLLRFDPDAAAKARARGDEVWWYPYSGIRHPMPNWFNGYPPSDTRLLAGAMSFKQPVDGLLYYRVERWVDHEPLTDGPFSSWDPVTWTATVNGKVYGANGDGSLYYPGPDGQPLPSIRIQNFRDGMEDYNLLEELRTRVERHPGDPAKGLLEIPDDIVRDRMNYTEDADAYRAWRDTIAAAIERLG